MSLKSRLGRLRPPRVGSSEQTAVSSPETTGAASATGGDEVAPSAGQGEVLASLRAKMATILGEPSGGGEAVRPGRGGPKSLAGGEGQRPSEGEAAGLPFERVETARGALFQRLVPQSRAVATGRIPLERAAVADVELLSLLSLSPEVAQVDPLRALYFDTETTGLGGAGTVAFLLGLAWFNDAGQLVLEQLLLESPGDESALLMRVRELFERAEVLVSFNGKSFDLPLLQSRMVMNRLPPLEDRPHLDLLHVSRRLHKRRLRRCNLTSLEAEVLGWQRPEGDVAGADIAPRYGHYLRTGDVGAILPVVEHNAWDVLSMVALVGLYGEPEPLLEAGDLLGLAETVGRAGDQVRGIEVASRAIEEGQVEDGYRVRARLYLARGDRVRALSDFEALAREVDDAAVRLRLAKLYEHHARDFAAALEVIDAGTGEAPEDHARRLARVQRKEERGRNSGGEGAERRRR